MQVKIYKYNLNIFKFLYAIFITMLTIFELYLVVEYIKILITNI